MVLEVSIIFSYGVIHKLRMWTDFWTFLTHLPPLWTILLNKVYVVIWTFGKPPPPAMSTWFMNAPIDEAVVGELITCPRDKSATYLSNVLSCNFKIFVE